MALKIQNKALRDLLEEQASKHADEKMDTDFRDDGLTTWEVQREKYRNEFFEAVRMEEMGESLTYAISDIIDEGGNVLDPKEYVDLIDEIRRAKEQFDGFINENAIPEVFNTAAGFSEKALFNMERVALDLFHRDQVERSVNIYTLLTVLDGNHADYWYKLGIGFQEIGDIKKALSAYACCHVLNPRMIGAYVFSAECYHDTGFKDDAQIELELAEFWMTSEDPDGKWKDVINQVKRKMR